MKPFAISRLNTKQGTFRITGLFELKTPQNIAIEITSIDIMGTDGWVLLDQKNMTVINLMTSLHSLITNHLKANNF